MVLPDGEAHEEVPADPHDEDDEVDDDEDPLGRGGFHVVHDHVDVLLIRHAVIVGTDGGVGGGIIAHRGPRVIVIVVVHGISVVNGTRVLKVWNRCHGGQNLEFVEKGQTSSTPKVSKDRLNTGRIDYCAHWTFP